MYEIEISQACGMVNCENTIYTFDRRTLKPTQAYHYFGYGGVILGDYFIATIRTAGYGQYTHEAFRVISHSKLKIENKSSFTVLSDFDQELGKPVCHFSLKEKFRSSALVKQIATEMCFPGALVKMDMH